MRQRTSVRLEADTALDILEVRRHCVGVGPAPFKQRGPGKRAWTVSAILSIRLKAGLRTLPCFPGQHEE